MTWFDALHERVKREGQRPHLLDAGHGRLLITEQGARVLACELPGLDHNPFFDTASLGAARPVTGGDRLWIAPEVAYYWPSLEHARRDPKHTAVTPPQIDPGDYQTDGMCPGGLRLKNRFDLRDVRNGRSINAEVQRQVVAIEAVTRPRQGLVELGFATTHHLRVIDGDAEGCCGAWSILQVPPTGTLICPTTTRVQPTSYYDPFGDRHVVVDDHRVRFLIDGRRRVKMGIAPEHTTGRMGYYRVLGDGRSVLIFRAFGALPGERYIDVPREAPHQTQRGGDALQAYNDDGDAFAGTTFGEMEYHDPAVWVGGCVARSGTSVTHVVAGPDAEVRAYGDALLGVAVGSV